MLAFLNARAARVIILAAFALAIAGPNEATAKSKAKRTVGLIAQPASTPLASAGAPVRYFTINQVLAKYDGHLKADHSVRLAAIRPSESMTDAADSLLTEPMASDEPFGMYAFRAPEGLLWVKWRKIEIEIRADLQTLQDCRVDVEECTSPAAQRLQGMIDAAYAQQGRARLETVNRLINNAIRYSSDLNQHGVPDLWSSPLAALASGRGDCEDYAIAKYLTLREAGIAADDLQLTLVRDRAARQDHAVLAVRHEGQWLILDNRYLALNQAADLSHFTPLFAIDHQGVKLFAAPYVKRLALGREAAAPQQDIGSASREPLFAATGAGLSGLNVGPLLL